MTNNQNQGASIESERASPKIAEALHAAVAAIYFDDSSDYRTALYDVVQHLAPQLVETLENNPRVAWEKTDAARRTPSAPAGAGELPPLPEDGPCSDGQHGMLYTGRNMQNYARAAILADRQRAGVAAPSDDLHAHFLSLQDQCEHYRNACKDLREQLAAAQLEIERVRIEAYKVGCRDGAAPASAQPADPEAELLDMLGRVHPYAMPLEDFRRADERLQRAVNLQQPWPVPDQAAIVWRGDLMTLIGELEHKRGYFDSHREKCKAGAQPAQRGSDAPDEPLAELIKAADAVVERWHSRDWKQPHTAEFISRLSAAVGAMKFAAPLAVQAQEADQKGGLA